MRKHLPSLQCPPTTARHSAAQPPHPRPPRVRNSVFVICIVALWLPCASLPGVSELLWYTISGLMHKLLWRNVRADSHRDVHSGGRNGGYYGAAKGATANGVLAHDDAPSFATPAAGLLWYLSLDRCIQGDCSQEPFQLWSIVWTICSCERALRALLDVK